MFHLCNHTLMMSEIDLSQKPDTLMQPSPRKGKSNRSWISFSIYLIIINLLLAWPLIYNVIFDWLTNYRQGNLLTAIRQGIIDISFLLPLVITDVLAVKSNMKKESPPWKIFMISLLIYNVTFFYLLNIALNQTAGTVAAVVMIPISFLILVFDTIVVLTYVSIRNLHREAQS
jgi:hypothetical protein